jgi:hypothetical protein
MRKKQPPNKFSVSIPEGVDFISDDNMYEYLSKVSGEQALSFNCASAVGSKRLRNEDRFFLGEMPPHIILDTLNINTLFSEVVNITKQNSSGSTAAVLIAKMQEATLSIGGGFIGDSVAFLCKYNISSQTVLPLERIFCEHSITLIGSSQDLQRVGGSDLDYAKKHDFKVHDGKLCNMEGQQFSLGLLRSLGDANHVALRREYEEINFTCAIEHDYEYKILVCTDGMLEKCSEEDLRFTMQKHWSSQKLADQLKEVAKQKRTADDITVMMLSVPFEKRMVIGVFDGHNGTETAEAAKQYFASKLCDVEFISKNHHLDNTRCTTSSDSNEVSPSFPKRSWMERDMGQVTEEKENDHVSVQDFKKWRSTTMAEDTPFRSLGF